MTDIAGAAAAVGGLGPRGNDGGAPPCGTSARRRRGEAIPKESSPATVLEPWECAGRQLCAVRAEHGEAAAMQVLATGTRAYHGYMASESLRGCGYKHTHTHWRFRSPEYTRRREKYPGNTHK